MYGSQQPSRPLRRRLRDLLTQLTSIVDVDSPPSRSSDLTLNEVELTLGGRPVLQGVSIPFARGVTAIVGRNGAGKTSLIRVVTGVVRPQAGTVSRSGYEAFADRDSLAAHRRSLGWLPQEPGFAPAMSVKSLVTYAAWLRQISRGSRVQAVQEALARVDLIEYGDRAIGQLSGGQRRRAALAAAMVGTPPLLLLDEPTSGLDPLQRERLLTRVRDFSREGTVVVATHLLEDVALVADHWLAMGDGRVIASGDIERTSEAAIGRSLALVRDVLARSGPE